MIEFTGRQLEEITGGTLIGCEQSHLFNVPQFFVDSRSAIRDGVFVALVGERVDGHDFLDSVYEAGAALAIVDTAPGRPMVEGLSVLRVLSPLRALAQIAHWVRVNVLTAQVIGVTGSSGKTSTKDLIAGILGHRGETVAPPGSFNTEVGLPLTILSADANTEFLILEMGMRGIGHISTLAEIAEPDIGVVVNVGSAHIELLGSVENIAEAKSELVRALPATGTAILNKDDPLVAKMSDSLNCEICTFGEGQGSDFRASDLDIEPDGTTRFIITHGGNSHQAHVQLVGPHYVSNALAAVSVCVCAGVPFETACELLSQVNVISKWRMEVTTAGNDVTVINDSYNANPESMHAALKTLTQFRSGEPDRRTWAVLGEMCELGEYSLDAHESIGRLAARLNISRLVCVGKATRFMHLAADNESAWGGESAWVSDVDEALELLARDLRAGDIVLVKASRSIGLERVASEVMELSLSSLMTDLDSGNGREQGNL
jgi:UDP-N-acetylmuramoyl-tripeptide--D-alanyl-D-alanine ligase